MRTLIASLLLVAASASHAETPAGLLDAISLEAKQESAAFSAFSPDRGRAFFSTTHGREWSCATCHTTDPALAGKHATTGKAIAPLAPAADATRFTDRAKVDKWFRRNCTDVAGRPCTAQEKGDILAWLIAAR